MTDNANETPVEASEKPEEGKRISNWAAFVESWNYVGKAMKDPSIQIRSGDKASAALLKGAIFGAFLFLAVPCFGPKSSAIWCYLLADVLFFAAAFLFVVSRFGVLRVMSLRHALVCWQLMIGTSLLSVAMAVNLVFIIVVLVAGRYIAQLTPQ
ncbi:MAG: hypothetical protein LCH63_09710 [Candidatus Melainabacteria bacterium]|jgi:hypothetical protein|nr:hypothetical protein [Candidatus Melainabacteria bacterium]OPZ87378.1 MAG: hypothetical protein BWY75_01896 [bacterium ADurb.Bin425]